MNNSEFKKLLMKRYFIVLCGLIFLAFFIGFLAINQNNCDLIGNIERADCDLGKLKD